MNALMTISFTASVFSHLIYHGKTSFWQINPIAETADNQLVAADAKLNFDDNGAFRQKEIFALRDSSQEDPREVRYAFLYTVCTVKAEQLSQRFNLQDCVFYWSENRIIVTICLCLWSQNILDQKVVLNELKFKF